MTRPEITAKLSAMLEKKINPHNDPRIYWAKEVTFDYSTDHAVRVDYMRFVPANNSVSGIEKGDCYCYEVKSSAEDFRSGHGLNFMVIITTWLCRQMYALRYPLKFHIM